MKAFALAAFVSGAAAAAPLVKVTTFVESGCPDCQQFELGGLNQTYAASGVADIISLDVVVFGNAYFATQQGCQNSVYDKTKGMDCWIKKCGGCGNKCAPSCFSGKILCQHGGPECTGNVIESCAAYVAPSKNLVPFMVCMSKNVGDHCADCVTDAPKCAAQAGIDWSKLNGCINNSTLANELIVANAKTTADYGVARAGTPWVVVNGAVLGDVSTLKPTVCAAYTGTKPAGCQ